jgi:hypothetical protein
MDVPCIRKLRKIDELRVESMQIQILAKTFFARKLEYIFQ